MGNIIGGPEGAGKENRQSILRVKSGLMGRERLLLTGTKDTHGADKAAWADSLWGI